MNVVREKIPGPSGAGKSGLALRMMALGAALVADDRVVVARRAEGLVAAAPAALAGLVEARGVGILRVPAAAEAPLALAVDLGAPAEARLPQWRKIALLGCEIDLIPGAGVPNLDCILMVLVQSGGATV